MVCGLALVPWPVGRSARPRGPGEIFCHSLALALLQSAALIGISPASALPPGPLVSHGAANLQHLSEISVFRYLHRWLSALAASGIVLSMQGLHNVQNGIGKAEVPSHSWIELGHPPNGDTHLGGGGRG